MHIGHVCTDVCSYLTKHALFKIQLWVRRDMLDVMHWLIWMDCHSGLFQSKRDKTELQNCSAEIEDCERTTVSAVVINQAFMSYSALRAWGKKNIWYNEAKLNSFCMLLLAFWTETFRAGTVPHAASMVTTVELVKKLDRVSILCDVLHRETAKNNEM